MIITVDETRHHIINFDIEEFKKANKGKLDFSNFDYVGDALLDTIIEMVENEQSDFVEVSYEVQHGLEEATSEIVNNV